MSEFWRTTSKFMSGRKPLRKMSCLKQLCVSEHRVVVALVSALFIYFLLMDSALYRCIQSRSPSSLAPLPTPSQDSEPAYSPFHGLTIKSMMLNHANHYIMLPLSAIFNQALRFSDIFYFISVNMISGIGVMFAVIAGYMVTSNSLTTRQWAALVFELRAFMDALDGIVFRSRIKNQTNITRWGSFGYYVDGVADTTGIIAFLIGVLIYLQRRQLSANPGSNGLPVWKKKHSSDSSTPYHLLTPDVASLSAVNRGMRSLPWLMGCFGLLLAISGFFWDHYILKYYTLLETLPGPDLHSMRFFTVPMMALITALNAIQAATLVICGTGVQGCVPYLDLDFRRYIQMFKIQQHVVLFVISAISGTSMNLLVFYLTMELQSQALKSTMLWSIVWLWRFCNSFSFMDMLVVSILVDKVWEFLSWIQFAGLAMLVVLIIITEIHYQVAPVSPGLGTWKLGSFQWTRNYLESAGLKMWTDNSHVF